MIFLIGLTIFASTYLLLEFAMKYMVICILNIILLLISLFIMITSIYI